MEIDSNLTQKINWKWIRDMNIRPETIKFLESGIF